MLGEQVVGSCEEDLVQSGAALSAAYATSETTQMSRATLTDSNIGERAKECRHTRWILWRVRSKKIPTAGHRRIPRHW
jgi:hypothetical protein